MTLQVEYEPVNSLANKQPFEQYISAAPTRMFRRDKIISAFGNPYIEFLQILTDRIMEFNVKFIRDKSGLRLARVLKFTLKMMKYAPLEGRGWQPLPEFLSKKKAIINIKNNDERCFGYALLYFLERENLPENDCDRVSFYKYELFQHHHLDTLPYPISPKDVHLYEDQLQININVFSFFDDKGRGRHPLVISRKNYDRVANHFYWKEHYAPISNFPRLFHDLTIGKPEHQICRRCLGHFRNEKSFVRHKELCTRDDFMSVLHVIPPPGSKQAQLKFLTTSFEPWRRS